MNVRRKVTTAFAAAAAASVIAGAAAFACTNLATLNLSSTAGKAGDSLTVTGSSFRVARAGQAARMSHPKGVRRRQCRDAAQALQQDFARPRVAASHLFRT